MLKTTSVSPQLETSTLVWILAILNKSHHKLANWFESLNPSHVNFKVMHKVKAKMGASNNNQYNLKFGFKHTLLHNIK